VDAGGCDRDQRRASRVRIVKLVELLELRRLEQQRRFIE
jgi:hypothetical protein